MSSDSPDHKLSNDACHMIRCSIFAKKIALENYIVFLAFLNSDFQNDIKKFPLGLLL